MNRASIVFLTFFLLASCAPVQPAEIFPAATLTPVTPQPTSTTSPPTPTVTALPPTQTHTPQICDPFTADYCITDGYFLFQRPIYPPANTSVDPSYRYASTAGRTRDPHHGVEFVNKFGTPVYAAGEGIVLFAGPDDKALYSPWPNYYGNVVVIQHEGERYTLYAHLSRILVKSGQAVLAGEPIGEVGQTGVAIGSHLHFEVRRGNVEDYYSTVNPELWLLPNLGEDGNPLGAVQISVFDEFGQMIRFAEFTAQYFPDQDGLSDQTYYGVTYSAEMQKGGENAAMGDLPAGQYRIALLYGGQLYERWVEVESGMLTQIVFVVK